MRCDRKILQIPYTDHATNAAVSQMITRHIEQHEDIVSQLKHPTDGHVAGSNRHPPWHSVREEKERRQKRNWQNIIILREKVTEKDQ